MFSRSIVGKAIISFLLIGLWFLIVLKKLEAEKDYLEKFFAWLHYMILTTFVGLLLGSITLRQAVKKEHLAKGCFFLVLGGCVNMVLGGYFLYLLLLEGLHLLCISFSAAHLFLGFSITRQLLNKSKKHTV